MNMSLEAFKTRVLPAKDKLYRFALKMLGDADEARDVVQEVFIKVWNKRDEMHELENMEAWCMRVTRNLSLDKLKSKKRKLTDSLDQTMEISMGDAFTPYKDAEMSDAMKKVGQYIAALPEKQKQIIQLRDVEGYSYNEICDILEIDLNQVKVNLFRARQAVRNNLLNANAYGL